MNGILVGLFSEAQLLAIVATATADITAGRAVTSYNVPGLSVTKDRPMTPKEMLLEARYALQILNPTLYGSSMTQKRTQAFYF